MKFLKAIFQNIKTPKKGVMVMVSDIDRVREMKKILDSLQIGFGDKNDFSMRLGPEPFAITSEACEDLNKKGRLIASWLSLNNTLYQSGIKNGEYKLVVDLIEGSSSPRIVEIQRAIFNSGKQIRLPLFMRVDYVDLETAVEVQIPGSGWGFMLAMESVFETGTNRQTLGRGLAKGLADGVRSLTGLGKPRVAHLLHKDSYWGEAQFFAEYCRKEGIVFDIFFQQIPPLTKYDLVIRHYMEELMQYPRSENLIQHYLDGKIEIEPPPNIITDQKMPLAFPFYPELQSLYPEGIRSLFPETAVLNNHLANEILEKPREKRSYIAKYGGLDPERRAGSRAVWNLADFNQDKLKKFFLSCDEESLAGHYWLVQPRKKIKFPIKFLNPQTDSLETKEMYARLTPVYLVNGQETEIIGGSAVFRNFWKVAGHQEAVSLAIHVQ